MPQKDRSWLRQAILDNPLLVQAVGLTVVIIAATNLRAALWISLLTAAHLLLCEAVAAGLLKKVPEWLRIAIYFALGLAIACPATYLLDQSDVVSLVALRMFLPLLALNSLAVVRCERFAIMHSVPEALRDAVANALGFALIAVIAGALREMLGAGTFWGRPFSTVHVRGFLMPFGGFLLLGAMAGVLKILLRLLRRQGSVREADAAMKLAPEDRMERLEKARQLMEEEEPQEPPADQPQEGAPAEPEAPPIPEEEPEPPPVKPIPVDKVLGELDGLLPLDEEFEALEGTELSTLSPAEKARLLEELESLLDDFQ